jgi:hypothetical protein
MNLDTNADESFAATGEAPSKLSFRRLIGRPEVLALILPALVGRLVPAMLQIPLFLFVEGRTGSYLSASLASAAFAAGSAALAPLRGRSIDARGAGAVLPRLALVQTLALAAIVVPGAPSTTAYLVGLSLVVGAVAPPVATSMRLEWQRCFPVEDARLQQAYSFESVVQVALFVVGPLLASVGLVTIGERGTVAVIAALSLAANLAFAARASRPIDRPHEASGRLAMLRVPALLALMASTVLGDAALGVVDVTVPSFARQNGSSGAAGLLLAAFAIGSVLGGVAYAARGRSAGRQVERLIALDLAAAVLFLPLSLPDSSLALAPLLLLAGLPCAIQWTIASSILDQVAPRHSQAEAYTWLSTANGAGIALGSTVAGAVIQSSGIDEAFLAGAALYGLAAFALFGIRRAFSTVWC